MYRSVSMCSHVPSRARTSCDVTNHDREPRDVTTPHCRTRNPEHDPRTEQPGSVKCSIGLGPRSRRPFTTVSGGPSSALYARRHRWIDYGRDLGDPGQFPYTRGIHATGYRGKLWTMRQFAGFGTPEETNERYKQLLQPAAPG